MNINEVTKYIYFKYEEQNMYSLTKRRSYVLIRSNKICWKIATDKHQVYLHVTFGGIFTIQQGLISCPFNWKTTLKI